MGDIDLNYIWALGGLYCLIQVQIAPQPCVGSIHVLAAFMCWHHLIVYNLHEIIKGECPLVYYTDNYSSYLL